MRRPTQHRPGTTAAQHAWAHPYTGVETLAVFHADGGGDPAQPAPPADTEPPKPAPPAGRVFTQAEVEALAAKEKAQGKRSAAKEFAEKHGFASIEDAETFIAAARQAQQDALSEQEKREQAIADREKAAEARERAAEERDRSARRREVLVGLGAVGDDLEDAAALLRVADDADAQAVADAANALKERRPELFGAKPAAPAQLPPAPGSAPAGGSPARQTPSKDDAKARAQARAVKMGYARSDAA